MTPVHIILIIWQFKSSWLMICLNPKFISYLTIFFLNISISNPWRGGNGKPSADANATNLWSGRGNLGDLPMGRACVTYEAQILFFVWIDQSTYLLQVEKNIYIWVSDKIRYDQSSIERVVGLPYYVHLVCRESMAISLKYYARVYNIW